MPRATKVTATARRQKAAESLVTTAVKPEQLARELGVTRGHASNIMRDPETRAIAANLLEPHRARIAAMLPTALDRIEAALDAGRPAQMEGEVVVTPAVPDHLMRLRAVDRLRKMVELLDFYDKQGGGPPPQDGTFRGTLEDLMVSYRRVTLENAGH